VKQDLDIENSLVIMAKLDLRMDVRAGFYFMNQGNPKMLAIMVKTKGWQDMDCHVKQSLGPQLYRNNPVFLFHLINLNLR
jgi:hypothetical protein